MVRNSLSIRSSHNKRVALVLGSGGARGFAHIGVIEELEARGYEIVGISGCSMGALIGGFYAAGKLKEYKKWVTGLNYFDLFRLVDVTWSSMGAIKGEKVMQVITSMLNSRTIESLPIPFTAVATDLVSQKEVWFQEGSLEKAIRASVAVPGIITPVQDRGRTLVDGGLLNPLPITPAVAWHADLIVAVNVTSQRSSESLDELVPIKKKRHKKDSEPTAVGEWMDKVRGRTGGLLERFSLLEGDANNSEDANESTEGTWGKLNIMVQSFETTQAALAQYKVAGYPPDVLIDVPRSVCKSFDFHRAEQLIKLGQKIAKKQLDKWEASQPIFSGDLDG
ncbi:patatin-like phospholipase family protein [Marinospirillum insulare]|uniref:Esterase n=1 Tax=Marinospirillum insulare TaxID=217169 RepID=A0ABQ5ZWS0_9GAMM|nr:patatin-like phospholipase family protein [Marinospirillum insulare]GLR64444.1 esterase [Marinospirillum insulare]